MSITVRDGQLSRTIASADQKLVAVDFSNPSCPPCKEIHPFWESLVSRYRGVVFCTVQCSDCPTECQQYKISATPTFVFISKGVEVHRFSGGNKDKIVAALEKYKGASFAGAAHSLGEPSGTGKQDFFEQLKRQRDAPKPPEGGQAVPFAPPPKVLPQETLDEMLGMGFAEDLVQEAFQATGGGSIEVMLTYIDKKQNGPPPQENAPDSKEARVAGDVEKELDAEGQAALAYLAEMGYDSDLAHLAINIAGASNIPGCVDIIGKIQRGEPVPMPKRRFTKEEQAEQLTLLRQRAAEKKEQAKPTAKTSAQDERQRRKDVLENLELKQKMEEQKREQALRDAAKAKVRDAQEREKVRQRIAAQRAEMKGGQAAGQAPAPAAPATSAAPAAAPRAAATECTLRFVFPDGSSHVQKFPPSHTLAKVAQEVSHVKTELNTRRFAFETAFPKKTIGQGTPDYNKQLGALDLMPRAQLTIKYL